MTATCLPSRRPLRLLPAPPTDPPYDDEVAAGSAPMVDGSLALAFPAPPEVPLRLVPPALDDDAGPPTPRVALPAPGPHTRRLVQALVEVMVGDRPAGQLSRFATLDVLEVLERSVQHLPRTAGRRATARPFVTSVHVTEPADGVTEACAVVQAGPRRRAVALRLEGRDGRWQCTALRIG